MWQLLEKSQQKGFKITDLTAGEVELNKEVTKVITRISVEGW